VSQHNTPEGPVGVRPASVTLREGGGRAAHGPVLDPANQSLAEALGLVFRLLQLAMLGLFVYFALSGFQSIRENEKGVRLVFGKKTATDLPPGFQFSYPFPVGELVRVDTGEQQMNLMESFWPALSPEQKGQPLSQLVSSSAWYGMKPERDGSLITGDENLAHTQWQVRFHRSDAAAWIENVLDLESERQLVQAAVERGVMQAVGQVTIDELLKSGGATGEQGAVAQRAQEIAQETLDRVGAGLRIDQLTLKQKVSPFAVYKDFSDVQSAEQKAGTARDAADTESRERLNQAAGAAYPYLVAQIDRYEEALTRGDTAGQAQVMETIRSLLDGRPVTIDGEVVANQSSGRVKELINDARSYRTSVVSQARSDLERYKAKLAQFRVNPNVVVQGDWTDAMSKLLGRESVDIWWASPAAKHVDMWLNRDVGAEKEYQELRKREKLKADEEQKLREANDQRYKTNTDMVITPH
jgi:regulator of protease activity HflC (stomatin/prohibitin superfamily)